MPRIAFSVPEWQAIAHELAGAHTAAAPPGLLERVHALLTHAAGDWSGQIYALEVDAGSAEVIRTIHGAVSGSDPHAEQRESSLAQAEQIIRNHQRRG